MKKRLFFVLFSFFFNIIFLTFLTSEVIILQNDKVINGKIIRLDEDTLTVYSKTDEFIIDREDIKVIYRNYEIYKKSLENNKGGKGQIIEEDISLKEKTAEVKEEIREKNLVINGDFESGNYFTTFYSGSFFFDKGYISVYWTLDDHNNSYADLEFRDGMAIIYVEDNKEENVNFYQMGILLEKGKSYVLEFQAKASSPILINVNCQQYGMKTPTYYLNKSIRLTDELKDFKFEFKMLKETNHNSRLEFRIYKKFNTIYIDNVKLYEKK